MLNWLSPLGSTSRRTEDSIGSDSGSPNERKACVKSCVWNNNWRMLFFMAKCKFRSHWNRGNQIDLISASKHQAEYNVTSN